MKLIKSKFTVKCLEVNISALEPYIKVKMIPYFNAEIHELSFTHFLFINSSDEDNQELVDKILKRESDIDVIVEFATNVKSVKYILNNANR